MSSYIVYKHTSPSGKVYIGITCQKNAKRWGRGGAGYKHSPHLMAAIKKYGWDAFQHDILAEGLTKEAACAMEVCLIAEYDSTNPAKGYNADKGGSAPGRASAATRQKMRDAHTGARNHNYGKKFSPITRERLSAARRGEKHPNYGKHLSEETRQKIGQSREKPVLCLDTGALYPSVQAAASSTRSIASKVGDVCHGRRKTTNGLRFVFIREEVIA